MSVSREEFDAAVERLRERFPAVEGRVPRCASEQVVCAVLGLDEPPRKKPEPWSRIGDTPWVKVAWREQPPARVSVCIGGIWASLTPDEARGMAAALIAHADYADYAYPKGADDE